jgi:hypothetical protein
MKRLSQIAAAGALLGQELALVSQLSSTVKIAATTLSALASDNSYNDSASGFLTAGFAVGDQVNVVGFTGNTANNIYTASITALTAAKMTIGGVDGNVIVDDAAGETVTITRWDSRRTSLSAIAALSAGSFSAVNMLINGRFNINQRQRSGSVVLAAGVYGHDRWKAGAAGCTYTFSQANGITTLTISAGSLIQVVEGSNVRSGTHVLSWTGTAQGKFAGGAYSASGVTGVLTGGANEQVEFGVGTLTSVQLTPGASPLPFIDIGDQAELFRCQRYCFRFSLVSGITTIFMSSAIWASATNGFVTGTFPQAMRATPTLVVEGAVGQYSIYDVIANAYSACTAISSNPVTSASYYLFNFSTASGGTAARNCFFATSAQQVNSIRFEAEL